MSFRLQVSSDRLRELLVEGKVRLKIDTTQVDSQLEDEVLDLVSDSYSEEQAEEDFKYYKTLVQKKAKESARAVARAAQALPNWGGSLLTIKMLASGHFLGRTIVLDIDSPDGISVTTEVLVGPPSKHISFSFFGGKEVEDVLDAGDPDFFNDKKVEADYFSLVNELRHPGKTASEGKKVVTLYTARPARDRKRYERARSVPANIFLTTSPSEAEGYKLDFGGDRDIYKVRIQKRYLVKTLDTPMVKNYQAFSPSGKVPVVSISLY